MQARIAATEDRVLAPSFPGHSAKRGARSQPAAMEQSRARGRRWRCIATRLLRRRRGPAAGPAHCLLPGCWPGDGSATASGGGGLPTLGDGRGRPSREGGGGPKACGQVATWRSRRGWRRLMPRASISGAALAPHLIAEVQGGLCIPGRGSAEGSGSAQRRVAGAQARVDLRQGARLASARKCAHAPCTCPPGCGAAQLNPRSAACPEQDENPTSVERAKEAFPFAHHVEQIPNLGRESYVSWVPAAWNGCAWRHGWRDVTGRRHSACSFQLGAT